MPRKNDCVAVAGPLLVLAATAFTFSYRGPVSANEVSPTCKTATNSIEIPPKALSDQTTVTIALLVALSASATMVSNWGKIINETRTQIILGKTKEGDLSITTRRDMVYSDWMSNIISMNFILIAFGIFVGTLPLILPNIGWNLIILCECFAFGIALNCVILLWSTRLDEKMIWDTLTAADRTIKRMDLHEMIRIFIDPFPQTDSASATGSIGQPEQQQTQ